ncbi:MULTISPECIES: flagellar hook protein FlgE [unclassified Undibacterium]|uniref:flagellar hook protein FlgE n=2 Tax=Oxalobacteraceae TaxID=75682 RepID=UPI002AC8D66B|nr:MULTISPECIES: flagellar hook protein FlgE [unclassified Undibacterium]MEB0138785.1 flagellar hook protein FlgE [Undibacterium sp. CCC2.1]MEB0170739.1 flagellar hook protein FlgE [Undibacterium sp. CCC1.1]MEB0174628.1 flagellar hook protein FlgE [Undibacterium sp. CCC3.4]MEB0213825.1 flagellar hook protein FlgE [Undibacterium sp. 5I2]WPX42551.1 flagellar hook protein FlgE [Undibacterium sp. CCC3.4]
MGFQQGLSGLNASSKQLDVIGNNIANANTVGFKQAQTQFADVYANSLSGAAANTAGIGVRVADVAQQFTQGNISSSNNPLDIAINGNGFFRMNTNGAITYSRNGQFQLDKNGYITNSNNSQLTGYVADVNGVLSTGAAAPININTSDIAPAQTKVTNAIMNLDSTENVPGTQLPVTTPPVITPIAFDPATPTSYNNATSTTVYDSLGNSHVLQTFYVRVDPVTTPPATAGTIEWNVYATVDGNRFDAAGALTPTGTAATPIGKLAFNNLGALQSATPSFSATSPEALKMIVPVSSGAVTPINTAAIAIKFDYTSTTQFGSTFSVSTMKQDGFASGKLSKFNTGKDGSIVGSYTNGQTKVLGQVVLASFTDPNGLQSLGGNQWAETAASGQALTGPPNSGSLGVLTSSSTEDSNTDLTGELVNMITAQRIYQANAQTIKTQDQVLQTLVNLR